MTSVAVILLKDVGKIYGNFFLVDYWIMKTAIVFGRKGVDNCRNINGKICNKLD